MRNIENGSPITLDDDICQLNELFKTLCSLDFINHSVAPQFGELQK